MDRLGESALIVDQSGTFRHMTAGRISKSNMNFKVPAMEGVKEYVKSEHGEESWRMKILHVLHNHKVQAVVMSLLLLVRFRLLRSVKILFRGVLSSLEQFLMPFATFIQDVIILFVETFLVGHYPPCKIIERDCLACCPVTNADVGGRLLAESSEPICASGFDTTTTGYGSCDDGKWHTVHVIEMFLFGFTITILGTFFVEVHLEMIALGPCTFFRQVFYVLDYIIILVSLVLELLFFFDHEELGLSSISGLIIFARIWRFVRIGHGIIEVTSEVTHRKYEDLLDYAEHLETELRKNDIPLPQPPKSLHRIESQNE